MGQKLNDAAAKGATTMSSTEECARDMGLRTNDAALKDAQTKPRIEECVVDMGRRWLSVVAVMGTTTMSSTEECALDTEQGSNYASTKYKLCY
eukprot:scaffold7068_cov107-Skeletonema_dohrnii-CCMP3373.AAC.5